MELAFDRAAGAQPNGGAAALAGARAEQAMGRLLAEAAAGDAAALFELGVIHSTGAQGMACDLVEAHRWFNLAAAAGHPEAPHCRADLAEEMTAREIAEAQRRAREWLRAQMRRVA